jgi:hypothetical protein
MKTNADLALFDSMSDAPAVAKVEAHSIDSAEA